jgi:hypothetical protein
MVGSAIKHEHPARSIFSIAFFVPLGAIFLAAGVLTLVRVFREARGIPLWKNRQAEFGTAMEDDGPISRDTPQ